MTEIHVHLDHGLDPATWAARAAAGAVPDQSPYGYHRAADDDVVVRFSLDHPEGRARSAARRALAHVLGFDIVHAWSNRRAIKKADWVWTHTEREHLAVAALVKARRERPRIVAQTLWLPASWAGQPRWRRAIYRRLLAKADVHTFHTEANAALASSLGWAPTEVVRFGISTDDFPLQAPRTGVHDPVRVLALGNDRHRDWKTLHAVAERAGSRVTVRIASRQPAASPTVPIPNLDVIPAGSMEEIRALYEWSDVVAVPVLDNLHACGLTVVLEATSCGRPVVATDTAGLREQFDRTEINFVALEDPAQLLQALFAVEAAPELSVAMVRRAQRRLLDDGHTSDAFARRHLDLMVDRTPKWSAS